MKKLGAILLCGILSTLESMNTLVKTAKVIPLSEETTWLVHRTRIFPENGILVAGTAPILGLTIKSKFIPLTLNAIQTRKFCLLGFTAMKNSLHWSANSLVYPHEISLSQELVETDENRHLEDEQTRSKDAKYCILEPLKAFAGKKLQGNCQDIFHVGGHTLSAESIILVPSEDESYRKYIGSYAGTVQTYNDSLRAKVEQTLGEKNAPIIYPFMEDNDKTYFWENIEQPFLINDILCDSFKVSQFLRLDHTVPCLFSSSILENECFTIISSISSALAIEEYRSSLIENDFQNQGCSCCKKKGEEITKKNLVRCSKCQCVAYCSQTCQKEHWKLHKEKCTMLIDLNESLQTNHQDYLEFQRNCLFDILLDQAGDELNKKETNYDMPREKTILKAYRTYIVTLLEYLYSPGSSYTKLRKDYDVKTLPGFIAYVKMVREKVSKLAKNFESISFP